MADKKEEVKVLSVEEEVLELQKQTLRKQALRIAQTIMTEKSKRRKYIKNREAQIEVLNQHMMDLIKAEQEGDADAMSEVDSKVQAFGKGD